MNLAIRMEVPLDILLCKVRWPTLDYDPRRFVVSSDATDLHSIGESHLGGREGDFEGLISSLSS